MFPSQEWDCTERSYVKVKSVVENRESQQVGRSRELCKGSTLGILAFCRLGRYSAQIMVRSAPFITVFKKGPESSYDDSSTWNIIKHLTSLSIQDKKVGRDLSGKKYGKQLPWINQVPAKNVNAQDSDECWILIWNVDLELVNACRILPVKNLCYLMSNQGSKDWELR